MAPDLLVTGVKTLFDLGVLLMVVELGDLLHAVGLLHHQRVGEQEREVELLLSYLGFLADYAHSFKDERHNFFQLVHHGNHLLLQLSILEQLLHDNARNNHVMGVLLVKVFYVQIFIDDLSSEELRKLLVADGQLMVQGRARRTVFVALHDGVLKYISAYVEEVAVLHQGPQLGVFLTLHLLFAELVVVVTLDGIEKLDVLDLVVYNHRLREGCVKVQYRHIQG